MKTRSGKEPSGEFVTYTRSLVDLLYSANFFGDGDDADSVRARWESQMAKQGAVLGQDYDVDEFHLMTMDALVAVLY